MENNLKRIKQFFVPFALIFIAYSFSGAYFSDKESALDNSFTAGVWTVTPTPTPTPSPSSIVLNEAMVNPVDENGNNPDGEWVELYNAGSDAVDVNGWQIKDDGTQYYTISAAKTNTGSTEIAPGGFLAIYRNMTTSMFNNDGDSVRVFKGSDLVDSFDYSTSTDSKTWARTVDGSGALTDNHTPTPGGPNV